MFQTFAIIQGIISILLITIILLQEGKKGMGSVFGGSSGSVFGARGAGNLLTKVTSVLAFLFMLNSVWLAHLSSDRDSVVQTATEVGIQSEKPAEEEKKSAPVVEKKVPVEKKEEAPVVEKKVPVEKKEEAPVVEKKAPNKEQEAKKK